MARKRDYKAEYRRRIANAKKRGFSRSQARGHPKPAERAIRPKRVKSDNRLEQALRFLRETGNQTKAAKRAGVSAERLRRFTRQNKLAKWDGRTWTITDRRKREMGVISNGEYTKRFLAGAEQASLNGSYLNAVKSFLNSNDIAHLEPFAGREIEDANGKTHLLETDPNALHRIAAAGEEVFHEIYRLVT